jgi:molybdate transport system ATP-binding protein
MLDVVINKKLYYYNLNIDFKLFKHQILVLWGPSGSGKTTVLECLAGLRTPDDGYIELDNKVLYSNRTNLPARERQIGYLFQDYALFPHMTIEQNIIYGLKCHKKNPAANDVVDYRRLLETFGLLHLIDRYPDQLSGGEKQRVAMIRALVIKPKLLLLDEPFSALDHDSKIILRKEIMNLHQEWQIPMIIVTHDKEDAKLLGDVIISLKQGQIVNRTLSDSKISFSLVKT